MTCLLVTRALSALAFICPSIDPLAVLTQGTAEEYPPPKGTKPLARTIKPPRLAFAGNYSARGCYQHTRGLLRGVAFFSLGSCDLDDSTQEEVRMLARVVSGVLCAPERDVRHWITRECLSRSTLIQPVTLTLRRLCTRGRGADPRPTGQRPTGRWAWALPPTAARSTASTTATSPSAPPFPHAGPDKAGSELAVMRFG